MEESAVHQGRGVTFFREHDGLTIQQLAKEMEITPSQLEVLEQEPRWEDDVLHKAAMALDRPFDVLRTFEPALFEKPRPIVINNSNTFNDDSKMETEGSTGGVVNGNINITTLDKIVDLYHDQVNEMKETIAALRKEIDELKKK